MGIRIGVCNRQWNWTIESKINFMVYLLEIVIYKNDLADLDSPPIDFFPLGLSEKLCNRIILNFNVKF